MYYISYMRIFKLFCIIEMILGAIWIHHDGKGAFSCMYYVLSEKSSEGGDGFFFFVCVDIGGSFSLWNHTGCLRYVNQTRSRPFVVQQYAFDAMTAVPVVRYEKVQNKKKFPKSFPKFFCFFFKQQERGLNFQNILIFVNKKMCMFVYITLATNLCSRETLQKHTSIYWFK